jgi:excisionase family DNA binding protein
MTSTRPAHSDTIELPPLLEAEQVAALIGMTVEWVWEQSRNGRIPCIRLGRKYRYRREAILQWLAEIEDGGPRS